MSLTVYRNKRNFKKTPEPRSSKISSEKKKIVNTANQDYKSLFVIQLHDASHLHYDFRLRIGRTLKSWAVPKGLSLKTTDKRLAVETEDHPLAYSNFEGVIPEHQYGAGIVLIWDRGKFKNLSKYHHKRLSLEKAYLNGHILFELSGKKLNGKFLLQKTKNLGNKNWLIIKLPDEYARNVDITKKLPKSIICDLTLSQYKKMIV